MKALRRVLSSAAAETPYVAYDAPRHGRLRTADEYVASLKGRGLRVSVLGEWIKEFVDHKILWPSVNAVAETYRLAENDPEVGTAWSSLTNERVARFTHVCESADDVARQNVMQRRLGQLTGTCFQRCVGMDAMNAGFTVTKLVDAAHGTSYHDRFKDFVRHVQRYNLVVGGAMTDFKGDRSKPPHEQPDMFLRVVERRADGVVLRGAKTHQTGTLNSHWMIVMPGQRLSKADADFAVSAAVPVDDPGLTYVLGRQSCDTRSLEGDVDVGNAQYGGQEVTILFDNVFVPLDRVFMDGETDFVADLVERFTAYHRRS